MAFAIHISDEKVTPDYLEGVTDAVWGEIEIEDFKERIVIPLDYWTQADYTAQWKSTIKRLIEDKTSKRGAFIVEAYNPELATYIMCWPVYLEDGRVYVHNKLLILENLPVPFDVKNIEDHIGEREMIDQDGNEISEWTTTIDALSAWLDQLESEQNVS